MINFTLNLLLLSLIFSILSVIALLFRHKYLHGKRSIMYFIWLPVLVLSVLPLRLCPSLSISGNVDIDNILCKEAEIDVLYNHEGETFRELVYSISEIKLTLIKEVSEIDPIARINALYKISPRIITGNEAFGLTALLDRTGSYIYPFFLTLILIWIYGVLSSIFTSIHEYKLINNRLNLYSTIYYDTYDGGRLGSILKAAQTRGGVRRRVKIRLVDWQAAISPCIIGLLHPVIYIGEDITDIDASKLELIISHELVHYKRRDIIYKMAALFVASIHWFNPLSKLIVNSVYEDCELSCDTKVLALYGQVKSDFYMMTILDIAEKYCRSTFQLSHSNELGGMYLNGSNSKNFLKRRYINMKIENNNETKHKKLCATSILILLFLLLNVFIMSACGFGNINNNLIIQNKDELVNDPYIMNPITSAINNYYGVLDTIPLGEDQIAGVKSVDVRITDNNMLIIYINGKAEPTFNMFISKDNMDKVMDSIKKQSENNQNKELRKFLAFYLLRDLNDPKLTANEMTEILELYPFTAYVPTYFFDQSATIKEVELITAIFMKYGFYINIDMNEEQVARFVESYISDNGLNCTYSVNKNYA